MLRIARSFLFFIALAPAFAFAATNSVGIPTGGIWFSKEPFYVGDQISVNTLVFNATGAVVRGTLELLDGATILQQKDVAVDPGDSRIVSFSVQVTRGKHAYQIRVAGGDFTGDGGTPIVVRTTGDYVGQTVELKREATANPASQSTPTASQTSGTPVVIATTSPITGKDAQAIADSIEKVLPAKIVEPVVSAAVPVLGASESFRVDQANANTKRIDDTIGGLAKDIGIEKVLGTSTAATSSKKSSPSLLSRVSAWSIFGHGVTSDNFIKSPLGYVKLFLLLLLHALLSAAWLFYGAILLVVIKIILYVKHLFFPVAE